MSKDKTGSIKWGIKTAIDNAGRNETKETLSIAFDILSQSPVVGFMWKNAEGWPVLFVTPNVSKLFGYTAAEFTSGKIPYKKVIHPEDLNRVMLEINKFSSDKKCNEFEHEPYRILTRHDEIKWVSDRTRIDRDGKGNILTYKGIIEDVAERIEKDQAIKESEEKYKNLFHHSNDGIFIHDLEGQIIDLNKKVLEQFGYTKKEMQSLKVQDLHPSEELEKADWAFKTIIEKGIVNFEIQFKRKNGDLFFADVSSSLFNLGELKVVQGIVRDITEKKQANIEKQKLLAQLHQAQKMEAIGTLGGGIAHNFNNLLMGIQGRASLLSVELEHSPPHMEHIQAIEEYIKSATELTKQLLGFARGGKYEVKPVDINELVYNSAVLFGKTNKEIKIRLKFNKPVPVVEVDKRQIDQVLLNLYINAWQAMPDGGDLYLETKIISLDETDCKSYHLEPGLYCRISVTDTGTGMDEATCQRVFDPFFTTKESGRGTGLGLASAYGIIQNHKGLITVHSETGHGTTFNIYLQISDKEIYQEVIENDQLVRGSETVLLVDDEQMILDVGTAMLEKLGYRVITARGGQMAVDVFLDKGNNVDLVILDLIMPGIDGEKVFDRIREIQPDIPVILSSGYAIIGQADEIMCRGCNGFLPKPFDIVELSQKVRTILDGHEN